MMMADAKISQISDTITSSGLPVEEVPFAATSFEDHSRHSDQDSSLISRPSHDSSNFRDFEIRRISAPAIEQETNGKTKKKKMKSKKKGGKNSSAEMSLMMSVMSDQVAEPEVFLRNPKTGGFDYTPDQHAYNHHFTDASGKKTKFKPGMVPIAVDAMGGVHYADSDAGLDLDGATLNDSTVYTSYTKKPLLPRKQRESTSSTETATDKNNKAKNPLQSFQRYFSIKANKTPNATTYSPPEGGASKAAFAVTPSPLSSTTNNNDKPKRKSSILNQLKCRVTGSPGLPTTPTPTIGERLDAQKRRTLSGSQSETSSTQQHDEHEDNHVVQCLQPQLEAARNAQRIMNSASRRTGRLTTQAEAMLITPPRSGRSPAKSTVSLGDDDDSFLGGANHHAARSPLGISCADASLMSSVLDFSFSTIGTRKKDDSAWTFDAVSPVFRCGRTTTVHDDAESVEVTPALLVDSSGFEADNDASTALPDTYASDSLLDTTALDILPQDALSLASAGALLLTEEGLKRHNDKKLQQESIEPLTLRQHNGVGKLEKAVLQQKVERLQAKEVRKQAETSLEEERAARKRRHMKAKRLQQQVVFEGLDEEDDSSPVVLREETPQKRNSPPRNSSNSNNNNKTAGSPSDSMSPQTSLGTSNASPAKKGNHNKSFLSKVLPWKKKPTAEELKRQWKERERQRVLLAQREKEEEERKERERIEELRQSYLEKQRLLEAAKPVQNEVDVDDLIEAKNQQRQQLQQQQQITYRFEDDKTQKLGPSSLEQYMAKKKKRSPGSATSSNPSVTAGSLPDLGSLTTMTTPSLGPCTVCQAAERTHIAMPCMHFAFCEACVKNQTMCPMCTMENVTFSRVNTE